MTRQLIQWPFGPTSIGFGPLFQTLQNTSNTSTYPPYNIWQIDESTYKIEIALAGFTDKDLTVTHEKNLLSISGEIAPVEVEGEVSLHKGISNKRFTREFTMHEYMEVADAKMKNGMLVITCKEVIPEALKPKIIKIS